MAEVAQDRVYEFIGHEVAYMEEALPADTVRQLSGYGYVAQALVEGNSDFQMRSFLPTEAAQRAGKRPIVAFRGSSSVADGFVDFDRRGVGHAQFFGNTEMIRRVMSSAGSRVDVTGHSLGGTLAQMAAAQFPSLVDRVVTFQAPGISTAMARRIERYNATHEEEAVRGTHYRAYHDVADDVGEAFVPGTTYEFNFDEAHVRGREERSVSEGTNAVHEHMSLPLRDLERSQGERDHISVRRGETARSGTRRPMETFRQDVLGLDDPTVHLDITPDEFLSALPAALETLRERFNAWMRGHVSDIQGLNHNHQFILLEVADMIFEGPEETDVFSFILNQVSDARAAHLFDRLSRRFTGSGEEVPYGVDREGWLALQASIRARSTPATASE